MPFDFENAENWDVSVEQLLPVGAHVVGIRSAEGGKSSGGYPQIELELVGPAGAIKDWLTYGDTGGYGVRKVSTLYRAAGVALSNTDQGPDGLTDEAIARLVSKTVGAVVHDEEDSREPGKTRRRVKGYVPASLVPANAHEPAAATSAASSASVVDDADIPF